MLPILLFTGYQMTYLLCMLMPFTDTLPGAPEYRIHNRPRLPWIELLLLVGFRCYKIEMDSHWCHSFVGKFQTFCFICRSRTNFALCLYAILALTGLQQLRKSTKLPNSGPHTSTDWKQKLGKNKAVSTHCTESKKTFWHCGNKRPAYSAIDLLKLLEAAWWMQTQIQVKVETIHFTYWTDIAGGEKHLEDHYVHLQKFPRFITMIEKKWSSLPSNVTIVVISKWVLFCHKEGKN